MDLIWVVLIIIIVISQLSQAKNKTQLRGRPFEPQRRLAPQSAPTEQTVRRTERGQGKTESLGKGKVLQPQGPGEGLGERVRPSLPVQEPPHTAAIRESYPIPDLRSAVVWSEIIAPPVSKRRGRR